MVAGIRLFPFLERHQNRTAAPGAWAMPVEPAGIHPFRTGAEAPLEFLHRRSIRRLGLIEILLFEQIVCIARMQL